MEHPWRRPIRSALLSVGALLIGACEDGGAGSGRPDDFPTLALGTPVSTVFLASNLEIVGDFGLDAASGHIVAPGRNRDTPSEGLNNFSVFVLERATGLLVDEIPGDDLFDDYVSSLQPIVGVVAPGTAIFSNGVSTIARIDLATYGVVRVEGIDGESTRRVHTMDGAATLGDGDLGGAAEGELVTIPAYWWEPRVIERWAGEGSARRLLGSVPLQLESDRGMVTAVAFAAERGQVFFFDPMRPGIFVADVETGAVKVRLLLPAGVYGDGMAWDATLGRLLVGLANGWPGEFQIGEFEIAPGL